MAKRVWKVFTRVLPQCGIISQAIAFNLFLAFFPTLLLAAGFASTWLGNKTDLLEAIRDFISFLPPGSQGIVSEFLSTHGPDLWKYAVLGLAGTLLGGSQVMKLLMDGIHLIYGDDEHIGFVHRQARGVLLLLITMAPLLAAGILGVFGREIRHWMAREFGRNLPVHGMWLAVLSRGRNDPGNGGADGDLLGSQAQGSEPARGSTGSCVGHPALVGG